VPLLWKTGHSLIKAKLKETGAPFAGEMSGHLFFGERWYGFDDAMYTAGRLLEILSRTTTPAPCSTRCPPASARPS
jgi:phosphomannomutase